MQHHNPHALPIVFFIRIASIVIGRNYYDDFR